MHKYGSFIGITSLIVLLALIRAFEERLFYDPYLLFFRNDYLYIDSPRREVAKLVAFTSLRFFMNTFFSLGIIYLFFKSKGMVKFSGLVYFLSYVFLLIPFLYFVINPRQEDYYFFFNVRRFLIQPMILILLLPALYYYRLNKR